MTEPRTRGRASGRAARSDAAGFAAARTSSAGWNCWRSWRRSRRSRVAAPPCRRAEAPRSRRSSASRRRPTGGARSWPYGRTTSGNTGRPSRSPRRGAPRPRRNTPAKLQSAASRCWTVSASLRSCFQLSPLNSTLAMHFTNSAASSLKCFTEITLSSMRVLDLHRTDFTLKRFARVALLRHRLRIHAK